MSSSKDKTFVHRGVPRHAAGLFQDHAARKAAIDEFEDVMEDAMANKKKGELIAKKNEERKEKEKQIAKESQEEAERLRLEAENMVEDTSHLMDEEIEDLERAKRQQAVYASMRNFVGRQMNAIARAFVDYGPPYKNDELAGLNLVAQCSNYPVRLFDLHMMLNDRANPNTRDPEDLYYAGMHWCARNFSVLAMKMLRKAGADINIRNELDQTPLVMCVMIMQHRDRRKNQLKAVKYLLEQGALVNIRDKAGYGPIVSYHYYVGDMYSI